MATVTLNANADVSCLSNAGTSNYGTATNITVLAGTTVRHISCNWDLSSIPAGARINSATLIMRMYSTTAANTVYAQRITGTWTETEITYNNAPAATSDGDSSVATGTTVPADINIPVTNIVKAWFESGQSQYGIRVFSSVSGVTTYFRCKESATDPTFNPRLYIDYTPVPQLQVNVGDVWKNPALMQVNIGDTWRQVTEAWVNIGDVWRKF